jgi:hypothetical protein
MRSSPTSTDPQRARRALAVCLAAAACTLLGACSEVTVQTATPRPSAVPTLPPIGFNHRYGNSPVVAADANDIERSLFASKEYWEFAIAGTPAEAGYVDRSQPQAVASARAGTTSMTIVIASEVLATLRAFVANGHPGQQAYCVALLDQLRQKGYTGLTSITMYVYFGELDRHAQLTWTPSAGYSYSVLDGNLENTLATPPPGGTPFPVVTGGATPAATPALSPSP